MSDILLEWMSYRQSGKAADLRAGPVSDVPPRLLENLCMLGHVEMPDYKSWKIAPPVLAGLPLKHDGGAAAILCGARTRGVLARIGEAAHLCGGAILSEQLEHLPLRIKVGAPSVVGLSDIAATAGIPFQNDAAYTLLACLPMISQWPRTPCEMVSGRAGVVQRFSRSALQWTASSLEEATLARKGFFRIKRDRDSVSILKTSASECAYIDDRAGRLYIAGRRAVASWNTGTQEFSLPYALMPPAIIARALALCSGALPRYDRTLKRVFFREVTPPMQKLVLSITGVRLS